MKNKKFICIFFVVVLLISTNGAIVLAEDITKTRADKPIIGTVKMCNSASNKAIIEIPGGVSILGIKALKVDQIAVSMGDLKLEDKIEFEISPNGPVSSMKLGLNALFSKLTDKVLMLSDEFKIKKITRDAEEQSEEKDDEEQPSVEKYIIEGCVTDKSDGSPIEASIEVVPSNMIAYIGSESLMQKVDSNGQYIIEHSFNSIIIKISANGYESKEKEIDFIGTNHIKYNPKLSKATEEPELEEPVLCLKIIDIEEKLDDEEDPQILMTVTLRNEGGSLIEVPSLENSLEYTISGPKGEVTNHISKSNDEPGIELLSGGVDSTILDIWDESLNPDEYEVSVSYSYDEETLSDSEEFVVLGDDPNPSLSEEAVDAINAYGLGMQRLIAEDMGYDEISAPFAPFLSQWNNLKMWQASADATRIDVEEGMKINGLDSSVFVETMKTLREEALNKHDDKITLELYSEDWVNNAPEVLGQIKQEYLNALTDPDGPWATDDIEYVPFYTEQQRNDVVDAINNYVKMATHDMFDKLLEYDDLSYGPDPCCDQTHFALLNVQYVNAKIPQRRLFDEDSIVTMPFYNGPGKSGGSTSAEFMTFEGYDHGLSYIKVDSEDMPSMQILEMKMEDEDHYLTFYQPTDGESLESIIPVITNDNIKTWKSSSDFTNGMDIKIHFGVPKLDIMYDKPLDIIPYLEDSGMEGPGNPFVPETANLSGVYYKEGPCGRSDKPGCISLVKFQCRMKLDEYGFEAAAAQDTDEVEAFVTLDEPFFMTFSADVPSQGSDDAQELILFMSTVCADGLA